VKINSPSVIQLLVQIRDERIPVRRLRGHKPSVVRFAYDHGLWGEYRLAGIALTALGKDVLAKAENCPAH
jgi:hypothetical protein